MEKEQWHNLMDFKSDKINGNNYQSLQKKGIL
jgi:hypothetical protein